MVVIIGAGNVGYDVATEARRLDAETISMIDIQRPLAFGKEKEDAEAVGATFRWPCFTRDMHLTWIPLIHPFPLKTGLFLLTSLTEYQIPGSLL
jgi:hypothetical protein